jgi:hypothetical protein
LCDETAELIFGVPAARRVDRQLLDRLEHNGAALRIASTHAERPACWNECSLESTEWNEPSINVTEHIDNRKPNRAFRHRILHAGFNRRNPLPRNRAAGDLVDELKARRAATALPE